MNSCGHFRLSNLVDYLRKFGPAELPEITSGVHFTLKWELTQVSGNSGVKLEGRHVATALISF